MAKKIYFNCGFEDECKKKDCLKCPRRIRGKISLTIAEMTAIEDFAVCDLDKMKEVHAKERDLMQEVMYKVMKKVFKMERKQNG